MCVMVTVTPAYILVGYGVVARSRRPGGAAGVTVCSVITVWLCNPLVVSLPGLVCRHRLECYDTCHIFFARDYVVYPTVYRNHWGWGVCIGLLRRPYVFLKL